MNSILLLGVVLFAIPSMTPVQAQSINHIASDEDSFWTLRSATEMIDVALIRYLVQLEIDDARLNYLRSMDSPHLLLTRFQLDSLRDADFGQSLLVELSSSKIPNRLLGEAVNDIWSVVQREGICRSGAECAFSEEANVEVDDIIGSLFPNYIEPSSGFPSWAQSEFMFNCKALVSRELGEAVDDPICDCSFSGLSAEFEPHQVVRISQLFGHSNVSGAMQELRRSSSPIDIQLLDRFERVEPILDPCFR